MISIKEDLDFGFASEDDFLIVLKNKHDRCIVDKFSSKWSSFDFKVKSAGTIIKEYELKTRRVNYGIFPTLIFGKSKWDYALKKSNTAQTLTGIWCAKEAVVKAISHKKEVSIIDIIIKHKKSGQPYVTFKKSFFGEELFAVSISHSKDYATAIAVFSEK